MIRALPLHLPCLRVLRFRVVSAVFLGAGAATLCFQFYDPGDAGHAKDRLDGYNLDGRNISVLYAQVG